jgi:transposase
VVVLVGGDDEQRVLLGDAIGLESIEEPRERRVIELELLDVSHFARTEPKQMSTGDRPVLGHISKRGNSYLRMLFIQAARVILVRPANWPKHGFGAWLVRTIKRLHPNVCLANKLVRIAWTVLAQERSYEARITKAEV